MKKLKKYLVSINYEDKNELFRHVSAHTKQQAELLVIYLYLMRDKKYVKRPLTDYKIKSCLEREDN